MARRPLAASLALSSILPVLAACATTPTPAPLRVARLDAAAMVPPVPAKLLTPVNGKADAPLQLDYGMVVAARAAIGERLALAAAALRASPAPAAASVVRPVTVQTAALQTPRAVAAPVAPSAAAARPVPVQVARATPRVAPPAAPTVVRVAAVSPAAVATAPALAATPAAPIPFAKLAELDAVQAAAVVKVAAVAEPVAARHAAVVRVRAHVKAPVVVAAPIRVATVVSAPQRAAPVRPAVHRAVARPSTAPAQPWVQRIRSLIRTWLPSVRV